MPDRRSIVGFGAVFSLLFLLLTGHWTAPANTYARLLRSEIRALVAWLPGLGTVQINALADPQYPAADLEILRFGSKAVPVVQAVPVRGIRLSSRSLGWLPLAVMLALALATPLDWRRRGKVMVMGLCGVNLQTVLGVLLMLQMAGQDDSTPEWQRVLAEMGRQLLVANLWMSFVGPLALWVILLTLFGFRVKTGELPQGPGAATP